MLDFIIQKAYAQTINNPSGGNPTSFDTLYANIKSQIVTPILYLLFALAIVYFFWGVMTFIQNAGNPEERKKGQMHIIYGIIGIFIMVSAIGIINIITNTL